jgi:hypothetical protein
VLAAAGRVCSVVDMDGLLGGALCAMFRWI